MLFFWMISSCSAYAFENTDQRNWQGTDTVNLRYSSSLSMRVAQTFIPREINVSSISLSVAKYPSSFSDVCDKPLTIELKTDDNANCVNGYLGTFSVSPDDCRDLISSSTPKLLKYTRETPISVTPGEKYCFTTNGFGDVNKGITVGYGEGAGNFWLGQEAYVNLGSNPGSNDSLIFQTFYSDSYSATTTEVIILNPANDDEKEGYEWDKYNFTALVPNTNYRNVEFLFKLSSDPEGIYPLSLTDWTASSNLFTPDETTFSLAMKSVKFNYKFQEGTYYVRAKARFLDVKQETDWSSIVRFYSLSGGGTYYQDCETWDVFCHMQNAFIWAFLPPSDGLLITSIGDLQETLKTSKPFSYLYDIREEFSFLDDPSNRQLKIEQDLVFQEHTFNFDFEIVPASGGMRNIIDQLRPFMTWLIWGLFIYYIYFRLTHMTDNL